jgi:hypothetical protein
VVVGKTYQSKNPYLGTIRSQAPKLVVLLIESIINMEKVKRLNGSGVALIVKIKAALRYSLFPSVMMLLCKICITALYNIYLS